MAWKRSEIGYTGIAFPFHLTSSGSVASSTVNLGEGVLDHIVEAITQLIRTEKGERFFNRDFGAEPLSIIFEPNTDLTVTLAADEIREIFNEYEPRVTLTDFFVVDSDSDEGWVKIRLGFYIQKTQVSDMIELVIG